MDSTMLTLKWGWYDQSYLEILSSIHQTQEFSDATIACDGKFYNVHKLVMSSCSNYLRTLFEKVKVCSSPITHPVIILAEVPSYYMEILLDFMYLGQINVVYSDLVPLIKAAEMLQIKGLGVSDKPVISVCNEKKRDLTDTNMPENKRSRHDSLAVKEFENISNKHDSKDSNASGKNEIETCKTKDEIHTKEIMDQSRSICIDEEMSDNHPEGFSIKPALPSNQMKKWDTMKSVDEKIGFSIHSQIFEIENSCNSKYEQGNDCDTEKPNFSNVDTKTQYDENMKNQTPPKLDENKSTLSPGGSIEAIDLWIQLKPNKDLDEGVSCPLCTKHCKNKGDFLNHYKTHTGDKPFACPHCSMKFVQRASLRGHIQTHTVGRPFACPICHRRFIQKKNLTKHVLTHAKEIKNISNRLEAKDSKLSTKHEIETCKTKVEIHAEEKMDQSKSTSIDERISVNHSDTISMKQELPTNQMTNCGDAITSVYENVSVDIHSHTSEHEYSCNFKYEQGNDCDTEEQNCSNRDTKTQYDENMNNQTPSKLNENNSTISPGGSIEAIDLWLQIKPNKDLGEGVSCPLCKKHCKNKGDFLNHYKTHTGDKPFACTHCPMQFVQRASLKNHIKTHTVERFSCPFCRRRFIQQKNLENHVKTHAGKKFNN